MSCSQPKYSRPPDCQFCGGRCKKFGFTLARSQKVKCLSCSKVFCPNPAPPRKFSVDLSGKRIGKLEVLHPTKKRSHGSIIWECKCECGTTTFVSAQHLSGGQRKIKSCGCTKRGFKGNKSVRHVDGGFVEIGLPDGKRALINAEDWPIVSEYTWVSYVGKGGGVYAAAYWTGHNRQRHRLFMHRLIMKATTNQFVDHRDGDGLNNRRSNLRFASRQENARNQPRLHKNNTTGFKGVIAYTHNRWRAQIAANGKIQRLGIFHSAREAAKAYNRASLVLHGDFASPNPMPEEEL